MGIDEINTTILNVSEWIGKKIESENRMGNLNKYLQQIGFVCESEMNYEYTANEPKRILVIGASRIDEKQLKGVSKSMGLSPDQVDFELDYKFAKHYNIQNYRYSQVYSDILIGPVCHKNKGIEGNNDLFSEIKNNPGKYPHAVKIVDYEGTLKITKTSFREAIKQTKIYSALALAC